MNKVFVSVLTAVVFVCFSFNAFSQSEKNGAAQTVEQSAGVSESLLQGYESYRNGDWASAMFFLRKSVAAPVNSTDETWYMLIMSEMYAGEYKTAEADCEVFERSFALSRYIPFVQYQKGRSLHCIGRNEDAVLVLSDFCHQNSENEMYASALYWIAESFYAEYNYDSARALYERIVSDFPDDAKASDAQYRIETIDQRGREEKLLYLLKVTGEEYLAAKEDYERQLKLYKTEDSMGTRKQLADAQNRIAELEKQLASMNNAAHPVQPASAPADTDVELLKKKAQTLQTILDKRGAEETEQ